MPIGPRGLKRGFTLDGRGKRRRVGLPSGSLFAARFRTASTTTGSSMINSASNSASTTSGSGVNSSSGSGSATAAGGSGAVYRLGQRLRLEDGRRGRGELGE